MTGGTEAQIMMETVTAQGFPILEAFKGVFIGPTINEIAAAVAGGTVGVMGTILALETGRQRAVERKQCPYCRKYFSPFQYIYPNIYICIVDGSGKLACGNCYAIGAMPSATSAGGQHTCPHCSGGFLQCNHVRSIPLYGFMDGLF